MAWKIASASLRNTLKEEAQSTEYENYQMRSIADNCKLISEKEWSSSPNKSDLSIDFVLMSDPRETEKNLLL